MIRTGIWLLALCLWAGAALAQDLSGLARLDRQASAIADDGPRGVAISLALSQGVPFRVFTLDAPRRLVMDFREYEVVRDGDEIVVVGTIREPVTWDFTIRICEDDLAGIANLATQRPTWGLLLRSLFKRDKGHHWSRDRAEQAAEARQRREAAREKAPEKVLALREASAGRRRPAVRAVPRSAVG